jgi:hypothetical protein
MHFVWIIDATDHKGPDMLKKSLDNIRSFAEDFKKHKWSCLIVADNSYKCSFDLVEHCCYAFSCDNYDVKLIRYLDIYFDKDNDMHWPFRTGLKYITSILQNSPDVYVLLNKLSDVPVIGAAKLLVDTVSEYGGKFLVFKCVHNKSHRDLGWNMLWQHRAMDYTNVTYQCFAFPIHNKLPPYMPELFAPDWLFGLMYMDRYGRDNVVFIDKIVCEVF